MIPIELMVEDQDEGRYHVRWSDDEILLANIPDVWLDLIPYMVARKMSEQGYNPNRLLIVRLRGADFDLMRARLGNVAATPLPNLDDPVTKPIHCIYRNPRHVL